MTTGCAQGPTIPAKYEISHCVRFLGTVQRLDNNSWQSRHLLFHTLRKHFTKLGSSLLSQNSILIMSLLNFSLYIDHRIKTLRF